MKATSFIPPIVALAIAGIWLGSQRHSIALLERQSEVLRKAIASQSSGSGERSKPPQSAQHGQAANDKGPINWKQIGELIAEQRKGLATGNESPLLKLQSRLQNLSIEELLLKFDEVARLDIPSANRRMLEELLISALIEKDPELALKRFVDRKDDEDSALAYKLSQALQEWAKKDPVTAGAWFDAQIAAGKFDSKSLNRRNHPRLMFEESLILVLMNSNVEAAAKRLSAMPQQLRGEVMASFWEPIDEAGQPVFAQLVRQHLTEQDQFRALGSQASKLVKKGNFTPASKFLDRIQASPGERVACVERAAEWSLQRISDQQRITRENLDAMRQFLSLEAPGSTGSLTGKAIANATHWGNHLEFSEACELALEYHKTSGNDDVLVSFLSAGVRRHQNKEQARLVAEKISDWAKRAQILEALE